MAKISCFAYVAPAGCGALLDSTCEKKGKVCPFYKTNRQIELQTEKCNERLVALGYKLRKPYRVKK